MAKKPDTQEKTPLQIDKKTALEETLAENQSTESTIDTPEKKRRTRGPNKPKVTFTPPTPEESSHEARFILDFIAMIREGAGIQKPLPEHNQTMFCASYHAIACKYGATMARWMPEIMFGGSLLLIGFDTYKELKIIAITKKQELIAKAEAEKKRQADMLSTPTENLTEQ